MQNTQRIIKFEAENFKRLKVVSVTPDGDLIVIGGENGAGKSSLIEGIAATLGGKDLCPEMPIRTGKAFAKTTVVLDDYVVTRQFSASGGSTLKLTNREGAPLKSPQELLDGLLGKLSFDPLDFARMADKKPREAVDLLKKVVGLDFTAIDQRRAEKYEQRRLLGRDLEITKGQLAAFLEDKTAPTVEVNTAELAEQLRKAMEQNQANATKRAGRNAIVTSVNNWKTNVTSHKQRIIELEEALEVEKARLQTAESNLQVQQTNLLKFDQEIEQLKDVDTTSIDQQIATADATNSRVRNAKKRKELADKLANEESRYNTLSQEIDQCDDEKTKALKNAKFPIKEISFDESGVLLNGVPFSQGSTAERLRASIALGSALNPTLRVILVREGNDLDKKSLAMVSEFATEHGLQIWLERCSDGPEVAVLIHDGEVVEPEASPVPAQA